MPKLSPISGTKLIKILSKEGFMRIRQSGKTSIPIHSGENVGIGLLRKILRDVNLTPDQFIKLK